MPFARRLAYALGSTGWQITDRIVVSIALYYYLPPAGRGLEPQVSQEIFLGVLTVFGGASLIGRLFDSLADPVVGWASDRSRSRLGRRRAFLVYGLVPMVVLPVTLFWPPAAPGSALNAAWLGTVLSLYFVFFTIYVAPYLALMPEIAWSPRERVDLSTLMAAAGLPVAVFGFVWATGIDWGRSAGLDTAGSIRAIVVASSVVALGLCILPILAVDEARHCRTVPAGLPLADALRRTLANVPFRRYLAAQIPFIVGVNLISPALVYYATVVLGRSEGYILYLGGSLLLSTIVGFVPVNLFARRAGPKTTIVLCVGWLTATVALLGLLRPDVPGGPNDSWNLVIAYAAMIGTGIPLAGFATMPNVLIAQIVDYDAAGTGAHRAAIYFGVQGFVTKFLYGISSAILAFLFVRFGNSAAEPHGVLLVGPVAAVFCLASVFLFMRYPEKEVLAVPAVHERTEVNA